jgi:hypothetical protein
MSRPSINGKPMTPAERKRLQRQRANVTKSHETKRDYQAEAREILDSAGEPNWTNEYRQYVLAECFSRLALESGAGLLTVYHVMQGLPKQQSYNY